MPAILNFGAAMERDGVMPAKTTLALALAGVAGVADALFMV